MDTNDFSARAIAAHSADMNIIGPDELIFSVDDLEACTRYLIDYGLRPVGVDARGGRFEALDGTAVVLHRAGPASRPGTAGPASSLAETVYGVADAATLDAIAAELSRDRQIERGADGSVACADDMGFALRFRRTTRRPFSAPADLTNAPGSPAQRPANVLGITPEMQALPRTLSHVVLFVPE